MSINVTPGTGKTVATETIGGVEYQNIKLIDGTAASTTPLSFVAGVLPVSILGTVTVGAHAITGTVTVQGTVTASIQGAVTIASIQGSLPAGTALIGGITSIIGAVTPYAQPDSFVSGAPSVITTTASVQVLGAPGSALRNYVTHILATNAGTVSTIVNIVDAGAVIYTGFAAASGGGFSVSLPVPLKQPTANLGLYAVTSATTSVLVSASGFKAA